VTATIRAKLLLIFGAALLALVAVLGASAVMGVRQTRELDDVERRLIPKAELGPRMEAELERLSRGMQDAVAAQDLAALEATAEQKTAIFELIGHSGAALEPAQAASLRWAIQDYFETARDVSRRMIANESGEALLVDVARMQALQRKATTLTKRTTSLDRDQLARSLEAVRGVNRSADRLRLGITVAGILVVALLALWGSRDMLQSLSLLSKGLARFGTGDFAEPIPVLGKDELAAVARDANQMAGSLQTLSAQREHNEWLKAAQVGLSEELRGELDPRVVAERALRFLAMRLNAVAGALYAHEPNGELRLAAGYATCGKSVPDAALPAFAEGEGLVGQALLSGELSVVDDLPADYLRIRSGLGESAPRQLLLLPLVHFGRKAGVIELALLEPCTEAERELLLTVRATLVIALMGARAGAAQTALLRETQAQAERLTAQEEELRLNNQELLAQQEELRRTNEEVEDQRRTLTAQNADLQTARAGLEEQAEELHRVSSYKSQFLANMSHELRTPLNSMLLLSHLLAENEAGNLTPKQVEYLRTVHGAGQDLLTLINEVLDLSKIEAGKQEISLESVETTHFVAYAKRLFEAAAAAKGLQLAFTVDADAPATIVTDRQRVERILTNLLGNALKFTESGRITLHLGRPRADAPVSVPNLKREQAVCFSVIDTGVGIPAAARERVFAPFEQVDGRSNRGHAGTGLGLSIARESARLLGGELFLQPASETGTTFSCVLPERVESAIVTGGTLFRRSPRAVEDDRGSLAPREPHLLIIEDDSVLAEQLVEIAHARRLKVIVVGTGEEGIKLAQAGRTLGIILDVKLPDVEGWTILERLKQDPVTRAIPVHFVSGVDAPERGLALGAVGYLVKPASHVELAGVVRTLVPLKELSKEILIVEDDAVQGDTLRAVLVRAGFAARHVASAAAALAVLGEGGVGCMILDLGLPDMDGLSLLAELRLRPEITSPRVVIHTGRSLTRREARELAHYSEAVVLKDGHSEERLLEELRLFVSHVKGQGGTPALNDVPVRSDVSLRGIKLLLAEDDMRTVYSLSALLRSRGAELVTAETGQEALDALERHRDIRGVLMDVMMPEMDGYEAMRRLRRDVRFAKLPVIALTAKAMKGERERCLDAGASDYLPKPIDGEKLLSALHVWMRAGVT
jgi:CheY-like chemotaxis protein/signal transduction histidine kinase